MLIEVDILLVDYERVQQSDEPVPLAILAFPCPQCQLRKLAVDMEVRHGRAALGAVVCAMAQQGFITIGA